MKKVLSIGLITFLIIFAIFNCVLIQFVQLSSLLSLILETVNYLILTLFILFITLPNFKNELKFTSISNKKWLILPFLVGVVNFPFYALISKNAVINDYNLISILFFKCVLIGVVEELLFRIIINNFLYSKLNGDKNFFKYVIVSSTVFSLSHLLNLIGGAGITDTLLQVVYTFLLGAMFTIVYDKTKNIWINVSIHSLFDFGGMLIPTLGYGNFQDLFFWILTVTVGVLCGIQITRYIIKRQNLI